MTCHVQVTALIPPQEISWLLLEAHSSVCLLTVCHLCGAAEGTPTAKKGLDTITGFSVSNNIPASDLKCFIPLLCYLRVNFPSACTSVHKIFDA